MRPLNGCDAGQVRDDPRMHLVRRPQRSVDINAHASRPQILLMTESRGRHASPPWARYVRLALDRARILGEQTPG